MSGGRATTHPTRDFIEGCQRVIVKVGTAVVTRGSDGRLALGRLGALVEQIEQLKREGNKEVILVTSGAVGVGRQALSFQRLLRSSMQDLHALTQNHADADEARAIDSRAAAAVGQSGLMALYDALLNQLGLQSAQLLVTDSEFRNPDFRARLRATADDLLAMGVVPVFNENDAISTRKAPYADTSGIFWDNDSLAALLALELKADLLVILSDVDGLYTGDPRDPSNHLIHTYSPATHAETVQFSVKSRVGRGGMTAKVEAAWTAAKAGTPVIIATGKDPHSLLRVVLNRELVGTLFHADYTDGLPKGLDDGGAGAGKAEARAMAGAAREASRALQALSSERRAAVLRRVAAALLEREEEIMEANADDVSAAQRDGTAPELLNRLKLKPGKLQQLAKGIESIADMDEPIGRLLRRTELAEGLELEQRTSPLGVLLVIFESRPDALPQIAALAIRSGNGLLLKGGKEAHRSNRAIHRAVTSALAPDVPPALVGLVTTREGISDLLALDDTIDLVIPRGSNALVSHIQANTKIPVLGHADGVCHMYVDASADAGEAAAILADAKLDYPAACNAVEVVLLHEATLADGRAKQIVDAAAARGVQFTATAACAEALGLEPAEDGGLDFHTEHGDARAIVHAVPSLEAAVEHIHAHGSGHTECIAAADAAAAERFLSSVDAACVMHNASTRFADGFRFGLGAEVGISTSRIHARGPVGVEGLLTTRWLLRGGGHVVAKDADIEYTHRALPLQ